MFVVAFEIAIIYALRKIGILYGYDNVKVLAIEGSQFFFIES